MLIIVVSYIQNMCCWHHAISLTHVDNHLEVVYSYIKKAYTKYISTAVLKDHVQSVRCEITFTHAQRLYGCQMLSFEPDCLVSGLYIWRIKNRNKKPRHGHASNNVPVMKKILLLSGCWSPVFALRTSGNPNKTVLANHYQAPGMHPVQTLIKL